MPIITSNFLKSFIKIVSDEKGPKVFILIFLRAFIVGIINLISSEFFLNSALCGFKPKKAIFGFLEKILLN